VIVGTGIDLCEVGRIEQAIARHGRRFLERVYTEGEIAYAERKANRYESYAARFAAKEAGMKALGTGWHGGLAGRDLEVANLASGRPTMRLTGGALDRLAAITPPGTEARIDVTITDEGPLAQAIVVISAVPSAKP